MYKENLHFLSHLVTHVKNAMMQGSRKNAILAIAHILRRRSVLKMNLLVFVPYFLVLFCYSNDALLDLEDDSMDPDLGDSSRFARHSAVRSTWSAGRNIHQKLDEVSKKEKQQQKRSTGHAFRKIGKLFSGK